MTTELHLFSTTIHDPLLLHYMCSFFLRVRLMLVFFFTKMITDNQILIMKSIPLKTLTIYQLMTVHIKYVNLCYPNKIV